MTGHSLREIRITRAGRYWLAIGAIALAACSNGESPGGPPKDGADMSNYVAIGTSVSMGVASDGVVQSSQESAWPALLAAAVGASFTLPRIAAPGCKPPLVAPLINFRRADNSTLFDSSTCAPNVAGVTLPAQNVAVSGATAAEAVAVTPAASQNPLYSRVLLPQQTQLTAMLSKSPTFVSVELGAGELLPAMSGVVTSAVPFAVFSTAYDAVIAGVKSSGAQALLALLPTDLRKFPSIRTAAEIWAQRAAFATRNIAVNSDCSTSTNYVSLQGRLAPSIITAAIRAAAGLGPLDLSCANVAGAADGILTEADMTALNAQVAQMNAAILAHANANGYATFSLGALYDIAKDGVVFDLNAVLTSSTPFGTLISLDGIHPTAAVQAVLATAARAGIIQTYGSIEN